MPTRTTRKKATARKASAAKKAAPVRSPRGTSENRKQVARDKLASYKEGQQNDAERAKRSLHRMYGGMLKAFNAGLTYDEIAEICDLSKIRVSQVLADQRSQNGQ